MVLPFVRELLAGFERTEAFDGVRPHRGGGTGRRRVSGVTATARALYLPFFVRAANAPCVIIVSDNKAAETLHAAVLAACELTGALSPDSVLRLPAHDVLPFENLSPHPEIQESRAATLWKIATGTARLVIAPVEAACMKLFPRDYYSALALRLRVGEEYMPDMLVEHLLSVGYTRVDVVGAIRKSDPEPQRSSSALDEALLLPLTETPVTEKLLTAINARLTRAGTAGAALEGGEEPAELLTHVSTRTGEATVFPGWEFFAPVAGAKLSLLDLLSATGPNPRVFIEEPAMVKNQGERWWHKAEQRHDRSGIGHLVRPEAIYLARWDVDDRLLRFTGCELDQLGAVDVLDGDRSDLSEVDFATRPTQRFHGSIPALIDTINGLMKQEARILLTAPNQGEVERLAGLLQEDQVPYRLGSRTDQHGSSTVYSESSYLAGDLRTPVIVKTSIAPGVQILALHKP